jgi:hypothetical protein
MDQNQRPPAAGDQEDRTVTLAIVVLSLIAFGVLAMRESPLWQWGVAALAGSG